MVLFYFVSLLSSITGFYVGAKSGFRLDRLEKTNLLNLGLLVLMVFALLMVAWHSGYLSETVSVGFMMTVYSLFAGLFSGYGWRLSRLRKHSGYLLYVHRSFLIDHAPAFAAILLIIYGIYRTSLLGELPVTGIRLTSGLSIISAGLMGWMVKPVPEFKSVGILLIDHIVSWDRVIRWNWENEYVLSVDYLPEKINRESGVRRLLTSIPEDDRIEVESILKSRMEEFKDKREHNLRIG